MGQPIDVASTVVGDSVIFDTDRSITGQDGALFTSAEQAGSADDFPNVLAQRLFEVDDTIGSVFVASNVVTVTRNGGWDDAAVDAAADVVSNFFVFYTA